MVDAVAGAAILGLLGLMASVVPQDGAAPGQTPPPPVTSSNQVP